MNLHKLLCARAHASNPVRVGIINDYTDAQLRSLTGYDYIVQAVNAH